MWIDSKITGAAVDANEVTAIQATQVGWAHTEAIFAIELVCRGQQHAITYDEAQGHTEADPPVREAMEAAKAAVAAAKCHCRH